MTADICRYCRLPIARGWHSPGWCFDYVDLPSTPLPVRTPSSPAASPEASARYRAGLCRDCGLAPYSAGRPRCEGCHAKWSSGPVEPGLSARRIAACAQCGRPGAVPGRVLCGPCRRERES